MTQLTFLDAATGIPRTNMEHLARTSDQVTAHVSAAETAQKLGRLHTCVLEAAAVIESERRDWTALEVGTVAAEMFGGMVESYRKRVGTELEKPGAIRESSIRACRVSGKPARAFVRVSNTG